MSQQTKKNQFFPILDGREAYYDNGFCNKKEKVAVGVKKFLFIKLKTTARLKGLSLERLLLRLMMKKIFCMPLMLMS